MFPAITDLQYENLFIFASTTQMASLYLSILILYWKIMETRGGMSLVERAVHCVYTQI